MVDVVDLGKNWVRYIHDLKGKLDRTDEENAMLILADLIRLYGIKSPSEITEQIEKHYSIRDKEGTADNRDIFRFDKEQRFVDYLNPAHAGKQYWVEKGDVFDKLCKILNIEKDKNFHKQIRKNEIYEEDIKNSDWYFHVIQHKHLMEELFGHKVPKDFHKNPLSYFKTFCLKIMGIVCTLEQAKGMHPDDHEALFKQHMKEDIYRKHYVYTPRTPSKKRVCSDDWINRKIEAGEELTIAERKLRALRKHVAIHNGQPRYKRYLSSLEKSPLHFYYRHPGDLKNKQNRRASKK